MAFAILVNARYAKNVPGRKTDVNDAASLQRLHSYGLLRGSFPPEGGAPRSGPICGNVNA
ncbi:hypothetical protein [Novosphingobium sp. 9]|uniref:hypothetical protein n=1 Tax=Novosphingobium sp. 9 TaxID=2025349 RepID=UPI0021B65C9D|nr:hypothetical protein [Novosphingobium sp. 9]